MIIDDYGRLILSPAEAFEYLYSKKSVTLENIYLNDDQSIDQFNNAIALNADSIFSIAKYVEIDESLEEFDKKLQKNWFIPEEYKDFNIVEFLLNACTTSEQLDRVQIELELFVQHGMYELLIYLKYLVDTMRSNNIVWGVGRGSSVASYCLYLLGIHKIDSIKYELDIKEFLK
jgi:DNA polymerase III alpha subunit